ncbi:MAG: hypothetical protein QOC63_2194, partial [Mycobacterium sp.]|nr:hypothetical protein [Mycobacterium sp.]
MTTAAIGTDHPDPPAGVSAPSYTYDAFLSYSRLDATVAEGIQKGLHRIARRPGRLHALRVFRDKTDLTATPSLLGKITDALDQSRYLIVVLSPHAAASEWVNKEVEYWLQHRGADNLLLVVAAGQLDWDDAEARFHPGRSDAAVPALTQPGGLPSEPIFVDVSTDAPWDSADPRFRDKITDLAAPIHGKSKYDLGSEDVREQRRFRRLRRAAIAGLVLLTVLALVATAFALVQQRRAEERQAEAIHQRNEAVARGLMSDGETMLAGFRSGGDVRALQEILAAHRIAPELDTGTLLTGLTYFRGSPRVFVPSDSGSVSSVAFSPDGHRIAFGTDERTVLVWDADTNAQITPALTGHDGRVSSVAFSPDGHRIISGSYDRTVRIWNADTG